MKIIDYPKLLLVGLGVLIGGVSFSVFTVMADLNPSTQGIPQVIPYQGVLELNGQPVNRMGDQAMWIEFQIYDTLDSTDYRYRQRIQVEVYQGRFTALIGPSGENFAGQGVYLTDLVGSSSLLYLGMVLLGEDLESPDDDIPMSNRQRLMSTPYAMWASGASQFTVQQDLTVGGTVNANQVQVNGQVTATGDLNSGANLNVQGNVNANGGLFVGGSGVISGSDFILGNNGVGKTNILDAIHYLSFSKSFQKNIDRLNIKYGELFFSIRGFFYKNKLKQEVYLAFDEKRTKKIMVDNQVCKKFSNHIGKFPIVMTTPFDTSLILDSSVIRRKFIGN